MNGIPVARVVKLDDNLLPDQEDDDDVAPTGAAPNCDLLGYIDYKAKHGKSVLARLDLRRRWGLLAKVPGLATRRDRDLDTSGRQS